MPQLQTQNNLVAKQPYIELVFKRKSTNKGFVWVEVASLKMLFKKRFAIWLLTGDRTKMKYKRQFECILTLKAICVEQILALLMALDPTLCASNPLPCNSPKKSFALVTVSWGSSGPQYKVVGCCTADGVYQSLEGLLINVHFLKHS